MGRRRGDPVLPCVICGTTGGGPQFRSRPRRVNVARFGIAGSACEACYQRLRYRAKSPGGVERSPVRVTRVRRPPGDEAGATSAAPGPPPGPAETVPHKRVAALNLGGDYSDEEREFLRAMDAYMARTGRRFPALTEVFAVLVGLGYRRGGD
jgi:hypothetical protein